MTSINAYLIRNLISCIHFGITRKTYGVIRFFYFGNTGKLTRKLCFDLEGETESIDWVKKLKGK